MQLTIWSNGERTCVLLGIKRICGKVGNNTGSQVPVFTNQISVVYQLYISYIIIISSEIISSPQYILLQCSQNSTFPTVLCGLITLEAKYHSDLLLCLNLVHHLRQFQMSQWDDLLIILVHSLAAFFTADVCISSDCPHLLLLVPESYCCPCYTDIVQYLSSETHQRSDLG